MRDGLTALGFASSTALVIAFAISCGGDPNDPLTWVEKLDRGAERGDAIEKIREIFRNELNKNDGNYDAPAVKALAEKLAPGLIAAAGKYKDDHESTRKMLQVLAELRDRRAIPVFIAALDFTPDVTEDEACAGAEGLGLLEAREGVQPMIKALERITGNRAGDNRMKRAIVEAFGRIGDRAAVPALVALVDKPAEEQDFFINKLATVALGQLGDPAAVPALIRALYMQGRGATIYQQARVSLAQIGPPAVPALIKAMRRQDDDLNRMAKALDFDGINPGILEDKCERILSDLGDPAATDALVEMLAGGNRQAVGDEEKVWIPPVRGYAARALVTLARDASQIDRAVGAILPFASEMPQSAHSDLYRALASSGRPDAHEFLAKRMMDRRGYGEVVRFWAADWLSHWGSKGVKAQITRFFETEPAGVLTELEGDVARIRAKADASEECDQNVDCWVGKLEQANLGGQAADRLGLLGMQGVEAARTALMAKVDHQEIEVRRAILENVARAHPQGCDACIGRLEAVVAAEEGRQRVAVSHNDIHVIVSRFRHAKRR
jgi:HEAT repeat protein